LGLTLLLEDVISQSTSPNWTLGKWAEYYHSPATDRDKIRNVISLEVSGTLLGAKILPPRLVREIDWVEKFWPPNKRIPGQYPKVQLYCLMSVAQCWTVSRLNSRNKFTKFTMDRIGTLILLGALYIITSFVDLKWVLSYLESTPQLKSRRYSTLSDRPLLTLPHMSTGTFSNTLEE